MSEVEKYVEDPAVKVVTERARDLIESVEMTEIVDEASDRAAKDLLVEISGAGKKLEDLRKMFVQPLTEHKKRIDAFFKEKGEPLFRARLILDGKVKGFYREQKERARKELVRQEKSRERRQERADMKAQEQGLPAAPPVMMRVPIQPEKTVKGERGSVTMRERWDFRIVDEKQIPREYLKPDEVKIRSVVQLGVRNIPGIVIFETEDSSVRGG